MEKDVNVSKITSSIAKRIKWEEINPAIEEFIKKLNEKFGDEHLSYSALEGRKYTKIIMKNWSSTSAYGFIDENGNIFKAATWERPAKHPRGHISSLDGMERYSPKYLK